MAVKLIARAMVIASMMVFPFTANADEVQVPVANKVTMVDLGSKNCIPCKMMAPVLQSIEKFYGDRAAIVFIDVKENPAEGRKHNIRTIPTQIFYDKQGNERERHEGYIDEKAIKAKIDTLMAE